MGIISKLRKLFSKNIECGDEAEGKFIYVYPSRSRVVHVNSNIVVGNDFCAVFVCNDYVCDVLPPGKHKIAGVNLAKTFDRLGLDRANKRGKYPKKFKADIYFVNKNKFFGVQFSASQKFFLKCSNFGKVRGYTEGVFDITVNDHETFISNLLVDRYMIKQHQVDIKKGILFVSEEIGNMANILMEKCGLEFTDIIINPKGMHAVFNPAISEKLSRYGITVENVELTSLKISRKLTKEVAAYVQEKRQVESAFNSSGIKYTPEQIVPNKVDMLNPNAHLSPNGPPPLTVSESVVNSVNADQPKTFSAESNANSFNTSQSSQGVSGPQIIKRGQAMAPNLNPQQASGPSLNVETNNVFSSADKKICKFCNEAIDVGYEFCPKCGFKQ